MPQRPRYHLIYRVLVVIGAVAAVPLSVGFLLIHHAAKARLTDSTGTNFVWFAEHAAIGLDLTFVRELEFLSSLSRSVDPVSLESSEALLREMQSSLYHELAVLDAATGRAVATSDGSADGVDVDRASFEKALSRAGTTRGLGGSFGVWLEEEELFAIYSPIRDGSSGEVKGLLRARMDTERLFRSVSGFRFGESGHACLIAESTGSVVAGRSSACAVKGRYARFEVYERAKSQRHRYFLGNVTGPTSFDRGEASLVAYATPDLSFVLPEHDWIVVVEQSLGEAHAPLAPMGRELILYFLGMGVLVVLISAYLSYRLERPEADVQVNIHESQREQVP